ncbi:MAG: pentapeptide repeat-containing protein [Leptolyngbyaceae cyanobacterium RM2_2_21]|nr:pentapeptide repeat-containing protein [Leptolyngbyaceae cyanobacterium RM2_2_21]
MLQGANLADAILLRANLREADLRACNLEGAKLSRIYAIAANFANARLCHAELGGANLLQANLQNADLSHAKLYRSYLSHANLTGASLRATEFSGTNVTGSCFKQVEAADARFIGNIGLRSDIQDYLAERGATLRLDIPAEPEQLANFGEDVVDLRPLTLMTEIRADLDYRFLDLEETLQIFQGLLEQLNNSVDDYLEFEKLTAEQALQAKQWLGVCQQDAESFSARIQLQKQDAEAELAIIPSAEVYRWQAESFPQLLTVIYEDIARIDDHILDLVALWKGMTEA